MVAATKFNLGPTSLTRVADMCQFVVESAENASEGEGSLVELIQTYPVLVLQLGLLWFCLVNTLMQYLVSSKFGGSIRRQSLVIAMVNAGLDIFMNFNVEPGIFGDDKDSLSTTIDTMNPFSALIGGKSKGGAEEKEEEEGTGPEVMDAAYLQRARNDMKATAQGRLGQMLAYIVISLLCGAKKHCMVPIFVRNFPFMMRGLLLLLTTMAPDAILPIIMFSKSQISEEGGGISTDDDYEEAGSKKRGKGKRSKKRVKKSYRQESRGRVQIGPVNVSLLFFPLNIASTQGDIFQDVCDLIAWPLEQMILSGWMKSLTTGIFGASDKSTMKLFGIPIGTKKGKNASRDVSPKMSKSPNGGTTSGAHTQVVAKSQNMAEICMFATKALFIYHYQKVRSKSIKGLKSLPRLIKLFNIPGGEALLGGFPGGDVDVDGEEQGSKDESRDDNGGNGPGGSDSSSDNDKDGGGGGRGIVATLPSAQVSTSTSPVPVMVDLSNRGSDAIMGLEEEIMPKKSKRKKKQES